MYLIIRTYYNKKIIVLQVVREQFIVWNIRIQNTIINPIFSKKIGNFSFLVNKYGFRLNILFDDIHWLFNICCKNIY